VAAAQTPCVRAKFYFRAKYETICFVRRCTTRNRRIFIPRYSITGPIKIALKLRFSYTQCRTYNSPAHSLRAHTNIIYNIITQMYSETNCISYHWLPTLAVEFYERWLRAKTGKLFTITAIKLFRHSYFSPTLLQSMRVHTGPIV